MLRNNLKVPVLSPEMQVWRTPLNQKLLITGACGVNKELIEEKNNFPRFNVIVSEKETDSDILNRIKSQGRKIINSLTKIGSNENNGIEEKKNNGVVYSTQNSRKHIRKKKKRSAISVEKKSEKKGNLLLPQMEKQKMMILKRKAESKMRALPL